MLPKAFAELKRFFLSQDAATGTELYLIPRANQFLAESPELAAALIAECEKVEASTWTKRFPILHSTFELDYVAMVFAGGRAVGFASVGMMDLGPAGLGLYLSEIMIEPNYQKRGLSKRLFAALRQRVCADHPGVNLYTVILSGHIALFRMAHSLPQARWVPLAAAEECLRTPVIHYLRRDIDSRAISDDGVVKAVWAKQPVTSEQVWPDDQVAALKLPIGVDLGQGDAVLRIFKTAETP